MSLLFYCRKCGGKVIVKYLKPGEIAVCHNCASENKVPEDAFQTNGQPGYMDIDCNTHLAQSNRLKSLRHTQLTSEISTIIFALFFYAINLHISFYMDDGVLQFQIPLIGRIIMFPTLLRLRKYELGWPLYSLLLVNPIFILFDISMLVGMNLFFYSPFTPLEFLLILCLLRNLFSLFCGNGGLIRTIVMVSYIEGALFICSFIMGIIFLLIFKMQAAISDDLRFHVMTLLGGAFFSFIIGFTMSVMLIFVAIKVRREIKRLLMPMAEPPQLPLGT